MALNGLICADVPLRMYSLTQLAVHRRSHSGEKPFECTVCSKRSTTSGELVAHSRIHSGEKPYKCHVCEKAFSQSSNLHAHFRVHTEINHTTVHTVGSCLGQTPNWSVMFVFTLMQSSTYVDTVHSVLHSSAFSRDICWSHTMKVLGWHVTFVRSSLQVVNLSSIYFDMKVWRRMHVVSVQSVSVQCMDWNNISGYTRITNSFVVVYAVKILSGKMMLYTTLRNVPLSLDLAMFNLRDDVCLLLSHFMCSSSISDLTMTNGSNNNNNNNNTNTTIISMAP